MMFCTIAHISCDTAASFFASHHVKEIDRTCSHVGFVCDDTLVAVMSYRIVGNTVHIKQFAERLHTPNALTEMLSHIVSVYQQQSHRISLAVAFVDRMTDDSGLYLDNGFTVENVTDPEYWYLSHDKKKQEFSCGNRPESIEEPKRDD